jgi:hypothetical protein
MTDSLELADVIKALRQELITAQQEGTGKDIRFNVSNVEVELETVVEKDANAKAGVKFWVLDINAEGKYKNAAKQKIKLSLKPKTSQGGDIDLSDDE